jgi:arylsulfatase A-like enzyme
MVKRCIGVLAAACLGLACRRGPEPSSTVRLVDLFEAQKIEGAAPAPAAAIARRTEWRFDGPPPSPPAAPSGAPAASPPPFPATRGFEAGPGIAGLAVRDGRLVGQSSTAFPVLRVERRAGPDDADQLHAVEVRLRASKGTNLSVVTRPTNTTDLPTEVAQAAQFPWLMTSPIVPGDQVQTYTMTPPAPVAGGRIRYVLVRPTDAAGADFAIESVRLIFRKEHLTGVPSGVSWQGLQNVFRETLVTRSPEVARFDVKVPARPVMHVVLGTPEDEPVTFRVAVRRGKEDVPVLTRTLTTAYRWEPRAVDLSAFAGEQVSLSLAASAGKPGTIAFWGAPAIRSRRAADDKGPPQTVLLVQLDTLRTDHLDAYGYPRKTAPNLTRLAGEGALFLNAVTQTGWTKAATPSIHTSLYPTTHGVHDIPDRLPSSATTIAESYRAAGYSTASFSSVVFTGQLTNLHQGFEEVHESESAVGRAGPKGSKTAREFVDRLTQWLEGHRDVPSFVYLHFFDPHAPYEPNRPFDTMWADPKGREVYERQQETLKKFVKDPFMAQRGMATPEELRAAGIDPEAYIRFSKDWYDGSIRAMDVEIARLVERLEELGLRDRTMIAFYADHGEEFHDHGRMWHGSTVYGEMMRVPLILWGPGRVPAGLKVQEPVQLIDVMPTLLDTSGLAVPGEAQGQSLRPLLTASGGPGVAAANGGWKRKPLVSEKHPFGSKEFPGASESYAIVEGNWKLIRNVVRPPGAPEFELYDFYQDPHDQKDVAAQHPDVIARLSKMLEGWKRMAEQARLKSDAETTKGMTAEQLERLRSLGYVR